MASPLTRKIPSKNVKNGSQIYVLGNLAKSSGRGGEKSSRKNSKATGWWIKFLMPDLSMVSWKVT